MSNKDYKKRVDYIMSLYKKDKLQTEIEAWDEFCTDILGEKANDYYYICVDITEYSYIDIDTDIDIIDEVSL